MKVKLRFFAGLRDYFRTDERETEIAFRKTVREIFFDLFEDKELAEAWAPSVRFAVNREYVASTTVVQPEDEVAFIPPVSGG